MKWFVTGGCGFIGQEVVAKLVGYGHKVFVFDAGLPSATGWHRVSMMNGVTLQKGDVCDVHSLENALATFIPDVVIHMAAQSHVDQSLQAPLETWYTNAIGTQNVAKCCAELSLPLVYCSTDEVYGTTPVDEDGSPVLVSEDHNCDPSSPYSASKLAGEHAVKVYGKTAGLRWAITRGSNAYGENQLGEKLIPIACSMLLMKAPVPLHGGGSQLRQWVHVADFADALIRAGAALAAGTGHEKIWNIAGNCIISVKSLVYMIAEQLGLDPKHYCYDAAERPAQDIRYAVSGEKIKQDLGWAASASLTDADQIAKLVSHYKANQTAPILAHYVSFDRRAH
jgi:dTDP-glucose 4,6-dehydratase